MLWMFLYKIYRILIGDKPIYNIIELDNVLYKNIKLKESPREGEMVYFNEKGPFYQVVRVAHHKDKLHTVWISVESIVDEKKQEKA